MIQRVPDPRIVAARKVLAARPPAPLERVLEQAAAYWKAPFLLYCNEERIPGFSLWTKFNELDEALERQLRNLGFT